MAISHAGHNHPATPAARATCRKSNGNPSVTRIEADGYIADHIRKTAANGRMKARMDREYDVQNIKMTGPVARRMARQAAKADAVRSRKSPCVQAALHVDAHGGRCACGWTA